MTESEFAIGFAVLVFVLLLAHVVLTSDDLPRPRGRKK